jgi:hypothetical protein
MCVMRRSVWPSILTVRGCCPAARLVTFVCGTARQSRYVGTVAVSLLLSLLTATATTAATAAAWQTAAQRRSHEAVLGQHEGRVKCLAWGGGCHAVR